MLELIEFNGEPDISIASKERPIRQRVANKNVKAKTQQPDKHFSIKAALKKNEVWRLTNK